VGDGKYVLSLVLVPRSGQELTGVTVNKKYDRLLAAADPENKASLRVLEKAGFQKGKYMKDFYERSALGGKKSDLQFVYLLRPVNLEGQTDSALEKE
jgi:L-amino acid N-acyltransferase YncA